MQIYHHKDIGSLLSAQTAKEASDDEEPTLIFDRNSLAYIYVQGCVYMGNKSNAYFSKLLQRTLNEDYNIPVTLCPFDSDGVGGSLYDYFSGKVDEAEEALGVAAAERCTRLINEWEYEDLTHRLQAGEELTVDEQQQRWVYLQVAMHYKLPLEAGQEVIAQILRDYVGPCIPKKAMEAMGDRYRAFRRCAFHCGDPTGH